MSEERKKGIMEKIVRTACQACHSECGVLVHVKDGVVIKVEGDPEHPASRGFICVKGRAQPQLVNHPDRLKFPMKRTGERGSCRWQKISWDQALDEIADKLNKNKENFGPEAFGVMHGTGPRPTLYSTALLASALDSPNNISVDLHICAFPSTMSQALTWGDAVMMDSGPDFANSDCILIAGGNPPISHPPRGELVFEALKNRKAKLIIIDPRRTQLAARADIWLQLRPGTDVALTMGMIKTIIDEDLYDKEFVEKWCHGFDQLKERVKKFPIEKVAELTWVPPEKISAAARMYATTKPASLHHRQAIEHCLNSTQNCRSLAILVAITGNLDVPGGNIIPMILPGYVSTIDLMGKSRAFRPSKEIEKKRIGAEEVPLLSGPDAVVPITLAPFVHESLTTGKPYPLRALFVAGGNPILTQQDTKSWWNAFKNNLELLVVAEYFMTPTAELADIVLPAATWMERDDICDLDYTNCVGARQKAIEPMGECWHNMKMTIELVKRIPWANRAVVPWNNVEEFNDALLKGAGLSFMDLKNRGYVQIPMKYKKYETEGFKTPTKKVELYCTTFEKYGYDPLPFYRESPQSPYSTPELAKEYPHILFTGARVIGMFHSDSRQIPALRKLNPNPTVEIHPEFAERAGLKDGDWVWIETPQQKGERVKLMVKVTDTIHPRMVHARHAWWFPEKPGPEHGCFESNINVLFSDAEPREAICASVQDRGTLCKIYK
jgi:anaerobic selenocysteine-containing dehydrogenase